MSVLDWLRRQADPYDADSWSTRFRRRRFAYFEQLLEAVPKPVSILDVGGELRFWELMGYVDREEVQLTLLNVSSPPASARTNVRLVMGDATDMKQFSERQFDVVFSNSVLEHVGGPHDQHRMADEVMRVGRRYFVQTPARWFPIEPHFLFPFFGVLPVRARAWLLRNLHIGWRYEIATRDESFAVARSIRLVGGRELRDMFPGSRLYRERLGGLTKSYVAYGNWELR